MYFIDWEKRKLSGHMTPRPQVGDIIQSEMSSGKIGQFEVIDVKGAWNNDPPDMFYATVKDLTYL